LLHRDLLGIGWLTSKHHVLHHLHHLLHHLHLLMVHASTLLSVNQLLLHLKHLSLHLGHVQILLRHLRILMRHLVVEWLLRPYLLVAIVVELRQQLVEGIVHSGHLNPGHKGRRMLRREMNWRSVKHAQKLFISRLLDCSGWQLLLSWFVNLLGGVPGSYPVVLVHRGRLRGRVELQQAAQV
jgi:hypothetical protein